MIFKCEKCGFLHYRTDPCKKPKEFAGSPSPVRPAAHNGSIVGSNPTPATKSTAKAEDGADGYRSTTRVNSGKKVQKPSVDTNQSVGIRSTQLIMTPDAVTGNNESSGSHAGSSNGRTAPFDGVNTGSNPVPASKFDKVAYQRAYMRKWRARNKKPTLSQKAK